MKKTLITLALAAALLAVPRFAAAGVDVSIGIGLPFPGFVFAAPPPVVYGPPVVYAPRPRVVYGPPVYYGRAYGGPVYVHGRPGRHWHKRHWKHHHWDD